MTIRTTSPRPPRKLSRALSLGLAAVFGAVLLAGATGYEPATENDAPAQTPQPDPEEAAVIHAVHQLFEAMRTNDGELAASLFHPEARLGRATDEGISFNPADGFIAAVGRPKEQVWDEPIWDWTVRVDGRLAQMWTKYAFYLDDTFSHCGTDAIELYRSDSGWQITQLVDTRRNEDCWYPPDREAM